MRLSAFCAVRKIRVEDGNQTRSFYTTDYLLVGPHSDVNSDGQQKQSS